MSLQIWKFPLEAQRENKIEMPKGATVLSVKYLGSQGAVVYARCDTNAVKTEQIFQTFATGEDLPDLSGYVFLGTFVTGSKLVFHVFQKMVLDDPSF